MNQQCPIQGQFLELGFEILFLSLIFVNFLKGKNFEVQNVRNSEKMEIFSRFFEESDKDFLGAILFQSR